MDFENLPQKSQYKFKEITSLTGVKPYVLRFWETEFNHIRPMTDENGQKIYSQNDLEFIKRIKHLLFQDKLSIPKAKAMLDEELNQCISEETQVQAIINEPVVAAQTQVEAAIPAAKAYTGVEMREAINSMIMLQSGDVEKYKAELARDLEEQKKLIKARQFDDGDLLRLVKAKKKLNSVLDRIDNLITEKGWA